MVGKATPNKQPKQQKKKEMHSQVERRRRERIRCETEKLFEFLPDLFCRDRLSTFQNALTRLESLTDEIGTRSNLLTANEVWELLHNDPQFFRVDVDHNSGRILYHHPNMCHMLKFDKNYFQGKSFYDLIRNNGDYLRSYLSSTGGAVHSSPLVLLLQMRDQPGVDADLREKDGKLYKAFNTVVFRDLTGNENAVTIACCHRQTGSQRCLDLSAQIIALRLHPVTLTVVDMDDETDGSLGLTKENLQGNSFLDLFFDLEHERLWDHWEKTKTQGPSVAQYNLRHNGSPFGAAKVLVEFTTVQILNEYVAAVARISL